MERVLHLECPFCHGELIWGEDVNISDVEDTKETNDTDIMSNYTCSKCGRYFEIFYPSQEDQINLFNEYWGNNKDKKNNE